MGESCMMIDLPFSGQRLDDNKENVVRNDDEYAEL